MLKRFFKTEAKSWIFSIVTAVTLAVVIHSMIFAPYIVEGASMEPTLYENERMLVNKTVRFTKNVDRGDIVIIHNARTDENYVKRVIGLPGEKIEVKEDLLYINNKLIRESYLNVGEDEGKNGVKWTGDLKAVEIPEKQYFVMGDNRFISKDSRNGLGLIKEEDIIGKSEFVVLPLEDARVVE